MSNVATMRKVLACCSTFDLDGVAPLIHEDIVLEIPFPCDNVPALMRGKTTFMIGMKSLGQIMKEFKLVATEVYDCPASSTVVFEMTSHGVLATGAPYGGEYCMMYTFKNGQVWHWREGFNPDKRRADIAALFGGF